MRGFPDTMGKPDTLRLVGVQTQRAHIPMTSAATRRIVWKKACGGFIVVCGSVRLLETQQQRSMTPVGFLS